MEIKGCSLFCRVLVVFTLRDLEAAPQTCCRYLVEVLESLVLPKFSGCRSSLIVSEAAVMREIIGFLPKIHILSARLQTRLIWC